MSGSSLLSRPLSAGHRASCQLIPACSKLYPLMAGDAQRKVPFKTVQSMAAGH